MRTIDVTDLVALATFIQNQKGKHIKQALVALEREGRADSAVRKIILDSMNNYARALCRGFGYNVEE